MESAEPATGSDWKALGLHGDPHQGGGRCPETQGVHSEPAACRAKGWEGPSDVWLSTCSCEPCYRNTWVLGGPGAVGNNCTLHSCSAAKWGLLGCSAPETVRTLLCPLRTWQELAYSLWCKSRSPIRGGGAPTCLVGFYIKMKSLILSAAAANALICFVGLRDAGVHHVQK